jgi:beta-lactamase superfamily II metal-dependent hydrolase
LLIADKLGIITVQDINGKFSPTEVGEDVLQVHFIDVGQGDSELIILGENAMLIDAGEKDYGGIVNKYLAENNVKRLDYAVATHPHSDHIGGFPGALENIETETFIVPDIPEKYLPTTRTYENFLDVVDESGAELEYAQPGKSYNLGEAKFMILSVPDKTYTDLNDFSVVILLQYGENKFLFTGDAEKKAEKNILEKFSLPEIDVLKLGHHGSSTSTSQEFIDTLKPKFSVAEVGADNTYGHPNDTVIENAAEYGKIYRTDLNGNILFTSDGTTVSVTGT